MIVSNIMPVLCTLNYYFRNIVFYLIYVLSSVCKNFVMSNVNEYVIYIIQNYQ